ncbi:MAG: hypothetical protein ACR2QM_15560 [Longimicrobiales bacterium]
MRTKTALALVTVLVATGCGSGGSADGQELHALKAEYADAESWPATSTSDVELPDFRPFRAVYERHYSQGLGPRAGEPRQDWVVVVADYASWDDREAIVVSLYDSGNPIYPDTNGRVWNAYVGRTDLTLFHEVGPIPTKAKDYYVWRQIDDRMRGGMLDLEAEQAEFQNDDSAPRTGVAIGPWAMAALPLAAGQKIRLDPYVGVTSNAFSAGPALVEGRGSFEDPTGKAWEAWQVDVMGSPGSPRVSRMQLVPEPPYLVARYSHNLETGEDSNGQRLVAFQYLEMPPTTANTANR